MTSCARTRSARRSRDALGAPPASLLSAPNLRGPDRILKSFGGFLRDTRAGATAIVAVAVTVMGVGGTALISDHLWLVSQRDTLKTAGDAAGIAATVHLNKMLDEDPDVSDDAIAPALQSIAERYVLLNLSDLSPDQYATAQKNLVVTVTPDRAVRTVRVTAQAEFHSLFGGIFDTSQAPLSILVSSGTVTHTRPTEVVLAVDLSDSMLADLSGQSASVGNRRIDIVKGAIGNLVNVLNPNATDRVAVGVVLWTNMIRLPDATAASWASTKNGWAKVPTQRTYGIPYECEPRGSCTHPAALVESVPAPATDDDWLGCLDGHRMSGANTAATVADKEGFFTLPATNPFAQRYYAPSLGTAYACLEDPLPSDYRSQICHAGDPPSPGPAKVTTQFGCTSTFPPMLPLSTTKKTVTDAVDALVPVFGRTYSALGVLWAQRMLDYSWNAVWGGGTHPVDPAASGNEELRKVIVLLTDGEDTHCGWDNYDCSDSEIGVKRGDACTKAKDAGTEIFVVAAIHKDRIADDFATSLSDCASPGTADAPYVFMKNTTADDVDTAFSTIAERLRTVTRVY